MTSAVLSRVLSCAIVVICTATCGDGGTTDPDSTLNPITGEWYRPDGSHHMAVAAAGHHQHGLRGRSV